MGLSITSLTLHYCPHLIATKPVARAKHHLFIDKFYHQYLPLKPVVIVFSPFAHGWLDVLFITSLT